MAVGRRGSGHKWLLEKSMDGLGRGQSYYICQLLQTQPVRGGRERDTASEAGGGDTASERQEGERQPVRGRRGRHDASTSTDAAEMHCKPTNEESTMWTFCSGTAVYGERLTVKVVQQLPGLHWPSARETLDRAEQGLVHWRLHSHHRASALTRTLHLHMICSIYWLQMLDFGYDLTICARYLAAWSGDETGMVSSPSSTLITSCRAGKPSACTPPQSTITTPLA